MEPSVPHNLQAISSSWTDRLPKKKMKFVQNHFADDSEKKKLSTKNLEKNFEKKISTNFFSDFGGLYIKYG